MEGVGDLNKGDLKLLLSGRRCGDAHTKAYCAWASPIGFPAANQKRVSPVLLVPEPTADQGWANAAEITQTYLHTSAMMIKVGMHIGGLCL